MFLRKLLVVLLPLLLCFLLGVFFPFLGETFPDLGFFEYVIEGLLIGVSLALLIPLMGGRKREMFSKLFWIPSALLLLTVVYQYLYQNGVWRNDTLAFLASTGPLTVLLECAFLGFLSTVFIREVK